MDILKTFLPICLFLQQQTPTIVTIVTSTKHPPATPTKRKMSFSANDDIVYVRNILELNKNNQNTLKKISKTMTTKLLQICSFQKLNDNYNNNYIIIISMSNPIFNIIQHLPSNQTFYFLKWTWATVSPGFWQRPKGLSNFYFGEWLHFHSFSVQSLYSTIARWKFLFVC